MTKRLYWLILMMALVTLLAAACSSGPRPAPESAEISAEPPVPAANGDGEAAPAADAMEPAAAAPAEEPAAETETLQVQGAPEGEAPAPQPEAGAPELVPDEAPAAQSAPDSQSRTYGLVAGNIQDASFNQLAYEGLQQAAQELGIDVQYSPTQDGVDFSQNISELLRNGADGIVTVGFELARATRQASEANPNVAFIGVDFPSQTANDLGLLFSTDEPSFMAGYLAAGMTQTGSVCTFGGQPLPTVLIFMVGFEQGVNYFNAQNNANVQVLGWQTDSTAQYGGNGAFVGDFNDPTAGQQIADELFNQGCDIIFPVAGGSGVGAAVSAQARGLKVIGVDADATKTVPQYADVYLTSVLKKVDVALVEAIKAIETGEFAANDSYRNNWIGTLANGGVGLAPFYSYDSQIPTQLKDELAQIQDRFIAGTLPSGWPISQHTGQIQPAQSEAAAPAQPPQQQEQQQQAMQAPPADPQAKLTTDALLNTTYFSDWTANGFAPLSNGEYRESIVPGAATQIVVSATDSIAFGDLTGNGVEDAALVLVTNPGGSGSFYDLAVVVNRNGQPLNLATFPLGDRVQINSINIQDGEVVIDMITHGPDDPMCCPTQPETRQFGLGLIEKDAAGGSESGQSGQSSQTELAGVYTAMMPAASSPGIEVTLELAPDGSAKMTSDYQNGEAPIIESGTWSQDGNQAEVVLTSLNGRPINNRIVFELQNGTLTAIDYDEMLYGSAGLQLTQTQN